MREWEKGERESEGERDSTLGLLALGELKGAVVREPWAQEEQIQ